MIRYHTTTRLWLSLEECYNAGITPEQIKSVIQRIDDPFSNMKLRCESMGVNGNWIVEYSGPDTYAPYIVLTIEYALSLIYG